MYVRFICDISRELYFIIGQFIHYFAVSIIFASNICWNKGKCTSYHIRNILHSNDNFK